MGREQLTTQVIVMQRGFSGHCLYLTITYFLSFHPTKLRIYYVCFYPAIACYFTDEMVNCILFLAHIFGVHSLLAHGGLKEL